MTTICWKCENYAVCDWAKEFKPIEGWQAVYNEKLDSYCVIDCPEFKQEIRRKYTAKEVSDIMVEFWRLFDDEVDRVTDNKRVTKSELFRLLKQSRKAELRSSATVKEKIEYLPDGYMSANERKQGGKV